MSGFRIFTARAPDSFIQFSPTCTSFNFQNAVNSFARFKSEFISVKKFFDEKRFNEALHQIPTFVVGESTEKLVRNFTTF
jgi:hypothetical protein